MNPPAEKNPDSVHKIVDWAIEKEHNVTESKFKAVDTRIDSLSNEVSRLPPILNQTIKGLSDLVEARLSMIMNEIVSVKNTIVNVDNTGKALDDKTDSLRDRLTIIEAKTIANHTIRQDSSARMFSIVAIVTSVFIGIGTIYIGVQHNESDKVVNDSLGHLQNEHDKLARTTARNPVEKNDLDLLGQRLDALSRRLNSLPPSTGSGVGANGSCPGMAC